MIKRSTVLYMSLCHIQKNLPVINQYFQSHLCFKYHYKHILPLLLSSFLFGQKITPKEYLNWGKTFIKEKSLVKKNLMEFCHKKNLRFKNFTRSDSHISGGVQYMLYIPDEIVASWNVIRKSTKLLKTICANHFAKLLSWNAVLPDVENHVVLI